MIHLTIEQLHEQYFMAIHWNTTHVLYTVGICGISRHSTVHENYDICMRATTVIPTK